MKKNCFIFLFCITTVSLTHTTGSTSALKESSDIVEYHNYLATTPSTEQRVVQCPQNKSPYGQCQGCFSRAYIRSLMALRHLRNQKKAASACS